MQPSIQGALHGMSSPPTTPQNQPVNPRVEAWGTARAREDVGETPTERGAQRVVYRIAALEEDLKRVSDQLQDVASKVDRLCDKLLPKDTDSVYGEGASAGECDSDGGGGPNSKSASAFGSATFRGNFANRFGSGNGLDTSVNTKQRRAFKSMRAAPSKPKVRFSASGDMCLEPSLFSADELVKEVSNGFKPQIRRKSHSTPPQKTFQSVGPLQPSPRSSSIKLEDAGHDGVSQVIVLSPKNSIDSGQGFAAQQLEVKDEKPAEDSDDDSTTGNPLAPPGLGKSFNVPEPPPPKWLDFNPLHSGDTLNTIADIGFIVMALALCVLMINALHTKREDIYEGKYAPWWLILICTLCELLTGLWMFMKSVTREGGTGWRSDTTTITMRNYVKSYFPLDLVYALPLELTFMALPQVSYWMMIRHWLRWVRIFSLRMSDNPFVSTRFTIRFVAFLATIILVHHGLACLAWGTFGPDAEPGNDIGYLDALYWAISTTTSTGYGDISPKTDGPRIFGMLAMISGGLIVAATTAFATSLLTTRDALEEEHEKKRMMMNSMLDHYQIPWNLRQHVITLFPHVLQTHSETQFKSMMESLPPGLSRQLSQYVQAKMLKGVSVFKSVPDITQLLPLVERLQQRFTDPGELIVRQGDDSHEMYFLIFGSAQVIREENGEELVLSTLYSGTIFGEMGVLQGTKRAASIVSVTACEIMVLTKEDFDEVCSREGLHRYIAAQLAQYTYGGQKQPASSQSSTSTPEKK